MDDKKVDKQVERSQPEQPRPADEGVIRKVKIGMWSDDGWDRIRKGASRPSELDNNAENDR